MKILHLISSGGMYGAEAVILSLCRTMNAGAEQSEVAVFLNAPHPNMELYRSTQKIGIVTHKIESKGPLDRNIPALIRNLVQQTGADIVHAHGYKADVYAWLALHSSATPLISTCHTWYDNDTAARIYGMIDRLVLRRYHAVVAVSKEVEKRLQQAGVPENRIRLIRNGIDTNPFHAISPRVPADGVALTVGLGGRLTQEKGIDLFLRAAHAVLKVLPQTHFCVVGDGPDRETLNSLIDQLDIRQSVSLLGRTDDMPAFYASLDLLVSSSRQEGLPIGLLEAMASGLPIIATSVGEVPGMIRKDQTGVLVPPEDVPALTDAIVRLLQDPQARACYGQAAREHVSKEFSAARMAAEYRNVYEGSIDQKFGER